MSETHTKTFAGFQQVTRGITLALTVSLAASLGAMAEGALVLKNVLANPAKHYVVVQFASGQPQKPKLVEMPSPAHQLCIDFTGVALDENVPSGDVLTRQLAGALPGVRAARVGMIANTNTVRVALDLDPEMEIKPQVVGLSEGMAVINIGDSYGAAIESTEGPTKAAAEAIAAANVIAERNADKGDPSAAYEEYYRKFLQQKQIQTAQTPSKEWGARRGTADEVKSVSKNGFRIIGTPLNSPALADVPAEVKETKAAAKAKPVAAPAPAEAAPTPGEQTEEPVAELHGAAPQAADQPAPAAQPAEQPTEMAAAPAEAAPAESAPAPAESAPAPAEAAPAPAEAAPAPAEVAAAPEQPVEAAPVQEQPVEAAPAPTRRVVKRPVQVQPESEEAAPQVAVATPRRTAPSPGRAKTTVVAAETDSAASPTDSAAASAGEASIESVPPKEQDRPENQPHVTSPADEGGNETPRMRARRLYNEAQKNHIHGHISQAMAGYKAALQVDSGLAEAHSNLGLAFNQLHNYASALAEFHKALAINPRDAITYNGVGAALKAEKDLPGAIKNWETAVKYDPHLAVAHYNLGTAYEQEGDLDRALVSYSEAVKNDTHIGEAYFRMGLIEQKRHRLTEAKARYKQALRVSENSDYSAEAREKIAAIDKLAK